MSSCVVTPPPPTLCAITVTAGLPAQIALQLVDPTGKPYNLATASVTFTVKTGMGGSACIPTLTNAPGSHTDPTNGRTTFTLSPAALAAVPPPDAMALNRMNSAVYEVRIVPASGPTLVPLQGPFYVTPTVGT